MEKLVETRERVMSPKEELHKLESEGKFVFHGSAQSELIELEPKQGFNYDKTLQQMIEDGEPAVSASPYADVAIFRSLINNKNITINHYSSFGKSGDSPLEFKVSPGVLEELGDKRGYVYVFENNLFHPYKSNMEWRSDQNVKPVKIIEVSVDDLPENIELIEK